MSNTLHSHLNTFATEIASFVHMSNEMLPRIIARNPLYKLGMQEAFEERKGSNVGRFVYVTHPTDKQTAPTPIVGSGAVTDPKDGVDPDGDDVTEKNVDFEIQLYGSHINLSRSMTHFTPIQIYRQFEKWQMEKATEWLGLLIRDIMLNGVNSGDTFYANGSADTDVNTKFDSDVLIAVHNDMIRKGIGPITELISPSPNESTRPIEPSYVLVVHPDVYTDILRDSTLLSYWVPKEEYGTGMKTIDDSEVGALKYFNFRVCVSEAMKVTTNVGATGGANMRETSNSKADLYYSLAIGADAYGVSSLKSVIQGSVELQNNGIRQGYRAVPKLAGIDQFIIPASHNHTTIHGLKTVIGQNFWFGGTPTPCADINGNVINRYRVIVSGAGTVS